MPLRWPIVLAAGDESFLDVVVWLVAGFFWVLAQIHSARKKQEKRQRAAADRPPSAGAPRGAEAPDADELAEIFKRLGANVPGTPPPQAPASGPVPRPAAPVVARPTVLPGRAQRPAPGRAPAAAAIAPALARRLARAKREAAEADRAAEAARRAAETAANAIVPGVQSRAGEHRALDTATRHTGTILPRMYAMGVRLAPLPTLPLPGFAPPRAGGPPLRARLHSRREIRDALVAQVYLQPPKGER